MAGAVNKYQAMIIDHDLDRRMRLRQFTTTIPSYGHVQQCNSVHEASSVVKEGLSHLDVIFIAHGEEESDLVNFLREAKETKASQDAAFILVFKTKPNDTSEIANYIQMGMDSFLFEPYSVNSLNEITELSARVKCERTVAREKLAHTLLVTDLIAQIDLVAFLKSAGTVVGKSSARLHEMSAGLKALTAESLQRYYDVAIRLFMEAPVPKKMFQVKKYGGVSNRVRERMEKKLMKAVAATPSAAAKESDK